MEAHHTSICWEYQAEVEEPWTAFRHSEQVRIQEARRRGSDELHLKSLQLLLFFSSMTAIGANDELKLRERRRSEQEEAQYISKLAVEAELRSPRQKRCFDGTRIYMNKVTMDDEEDEQSKPSAVDLSEDETDGSMSTDLDEVSIVHDLLELRDLQYVLASTYSSAVGYLYEHLPPEVEVTPILVMISSPGSGSGYKTKARLYDFHDGHPRAFCPSVAMWGVFHAKQNLWVCDFFHAKQNLWVCDFAVKAAGARTSTFARGLEQFVSSMLSVDHRHVDAARKVQLVCVRSRRGLIGPRSAGWGSSDGSTSAHRPTCTWSHLIRFPPTTAESSGWLPFWTLQLFLCMIASRINTPASASSTKRSWRVSRRPWGHMTASESWRWCGQRTAVP